MKLNHAPRCESCKSANVHHRLKTGERVCHVCGFISKPYKNSEGEEFEPFDEEEEERPERGEER